MNKLEKAATLITFSGAIIIIGINLANLIPLHAPAMLSTVGKVTFFSGIILNRLFGATNKIKAGVFLPILILCMLAAFLFV